MANETERSCGGTNLLWLAAVIFSAVIAPSGYGQGRVRLEAKVSPPDSGVVISTTTNLDSVITLLASTNLTRWEALGVFHDAVREYPDPHGPTAPGRFYRAQQAPRAATNDWKNQVLFPDDPFRHPGLYNEAEWVKFAIVLGQPDRVLYQDSAQWSFHYDFATRRIPAFAGMDRDSFDRVSLFRTNQQVVLGAVLLPPDLNGAFEFGVQFVGLEPYAPEEVARWFALVKASVHSENGAAAFYVPTFEQSETARTNRSAFESLGVPLATIDRWVPGDHCYAGGWALGRLKFFPAAEIPAAYADGRLVPADILLTDGVPAETPAVAGIISLRPSTPNSHTAILARSFGIPFVHFPDADDQARLHLLVGRKIILRADDTAWGGPRLSVIDAEEELTPEAEAQLLATRRPTPIRYTPKQTRGADVASTDHLSPSDIQYFGGKAANYGFLRRSVPQAAPAAIAFSFDLWDEFMAQVIPGGRTLGQEISARLGPFTNDPTDIHSLQQVLTGIRDLVRSAGFTLAQQQRITNALSVFDAQRNIRFRSSTNVEDSESFTGAGLYDSYSGCLLDDLDADTAGPSHCDVTENGERGVFRAIRRVYASFYNDNAFLERRRHQVKESEVAMGVLVHHSFPDVDELANGVATLRWNFSSGYTQAVGEMVTQKGAVSVTNPDGGSTPESMNVETFGGSTWLRLSKYSSLVPLGANVLEWQSEYLMFMTNFTAIASAFHAYYPAKKNFTLDYEYKKDRNLGLVVKQVREIPPEEEATPKTTFLVNEPAELVVAQQEFGDVFANHRLKSRFSVETRTMWLVTSNLSRGLYTTGAFEYVQDGGTASLSGPVNSWPEAAYSSNGTRQTWVTGPATNARAWDLHTYVRTETQGGEPLVLVQNDFRRELQVTYARPVPTITWEGEGVVTNEVVVLEPQLELRPGSILVERTFNTNGVSIETSFYWPAPPTGIVAGYTAPVVRFVETRIVGLTADPIILGDYYSQTYRPGHHNFVEYFVFEPGLEPSLPTALREELRAKNVQLIHLQLGYQDSAKILGVDGKFRPL